MKLDEEILLSLQTDLEICRDYIRQVSLGMLKGSISNYPIFVALRTEQDVDLGLPIVIRQELDLQWSFNASHLEEFVSKGIVTHEKTQDFIKNYKNPEEFLCVFVAEDGAMSFIFLPYVRNRNISEGKELLN